MDSFDLESLPIIEDDVNQPFSLDDLPILGEEQVPGSSLGEEDVRSGMRSARAGIEKSKGGFELAADIAVPAIGGAVGAATLGPVGIVPGAMAAKALQEGGEKLIGASKDRPLIANPIKQESVVGNVVLEGVSTIIGLKAQVKLAEYTKKIGGAAIDASYPKLKKFLQRTVDKIKPQSKLAFIEEQSQKISEALGIPSKAIKRVFERSPKKVLKDSFQVNQEMSKASIDRVSESFERVMSKLSDEFENKVSSQFKASDTPVDIDDIFSKYVEDLSSIFDKDRKTGALVATAAVDDDIVKTFNRLGTDFSRLRDNPSPEFLHKFKQRINQVLNRKAIKDNPNGQRILFNLKSNITTKLEAAIPGYKNLMNEYRSVFALEEEIGKRLEKKNVESAIKSYFSKDKVQFSSAIDDLMSKDASVKAAWNYALDQRAAKYFVGYTSKNEKSIGFKLPGTGVGARLHAFGETPRGMGKKMLKKQKRGTLTRTKKGLSAEGAARSLLGAGPRELFDSDRRSRQSAVLR